MARTPAPPYRTGVLWGVLALFLLTGTLGAAGVVYGFTGLLAAGRWWVDGPVLLASGLVAVLSLLFLSGILYRVDRLRGVAHREVRLFE